MRDGHQSDLFLRGGIYRWRGGPEEAGGGRRAARGLCAALEWAASRCKWRWCGSSWKTIIVSLARFFCIVLRRSSSGEWRRRVVLAGAGTGAGIGAAAGEENGLVWRAAAAGGFDRSWWRRSGPNGGHLGTPGPRLAPALGAAGATRGAKGKGGSLAGLGTRARAVSETRSAGSAGGAQRLIGSHSIWGRCRAGQEAVAVLSRDQGRAGMAGNTLRN